MRTGYQRGILPVATRSVRRVHRMRTFANFSAVKRRPALGISCKVTVEGAGIDEVEAVME